MHRRTVLILDPVRDMGELFARALEARKDCKCYWTPGEKEALSLIKEISFDLVLVDLDAASAAGFSLLRQIRRMAPEVIIIVDAFLHQKEHIVKALENGADGYIMKPIKVEEFRKRIDAFYNSSSPHP